MPLRDHFRPPLDEQRHWEGFHATWPVMMVAQLRRKNSRAFFAEPRTNSSTGIYEVLVYDEKRRCRLVAAVEIVSPSNKDRPEHRSAFVAKCLGLLREGVSVVIVDVVTTRTHNLYTELLSLIGKIDPGLPPDPPSLFASACRLTFRENEWLLETWAQPLFLGQALPTVPLWIAADLAVALELEESYEQSCGILGIA
jgi:hypothetical protein